MKDITYQNYLDFIIKVILEYTHLHPDNRQSNVAETNATQSLHVIPRHN